MVDSVRLTEGLALLKSLPVDVIPPVAELTEGSRVLHSVNEHFVGREAALMELACQLKEGTTVVATGLGGIGKTQLAAEFAHRYGHYFQGGVYWLNMADPASVQAEVALCGRQMVEMGPWFESLKLADQVRRVLGAWQSPLPRLLIFDNCESPELLKQWQPPTGGCRILVTSRRQEWDGLFDLQNLALTTLTRKQSITLLLKFRPDLDEGEADLAMLDGVAAMLGDLPLALHLVGSYLRCYRSVVLADYLGALERVAQDHLSTQDGEEAGIEHERHIACTFTVSTKRLELGVPTDQLALRILARAACFAPGEPIPRDLLFATLEKRKPFLSTAFSTIQSIFSNYTKRKIAIINSHSLTDALHRLLELGLIEENAEGSLLIHPLVAVCIDKLAVDDGARADVEEAVIKAAYTIILSGIPSPLLPWQSHLRYIADVGLLSQTKQTAILCSNLALYLNRLGAYSEALPYYEQALSINRERLGKNHPDTTTSLNNLGMLLQDMGKYQEAKLYYEQALSIRQEVLGESHPDTALGLNNLGMLLKTMEEYQEAKLYLEQALSIRQAILGQKHPYTARSLNNIGVLLQEMEEYQEAKLYFEQALSINREELGESLLSVSLNLNNLGAVLQKMGEYQEAKLYFEQALSICQDVLGEKHPDIACILNDVGMLLQETGEYQEAKLYYEQALSIRQEVLGERHIEVARTLSNLGELVREYQEARLYLEQSLSIFEEVLGKEDPQTQVVYRNLEILIEKMEANQS